MLSPRTLTGVHTHLSRFNSTYRNYLCRRSLTSLSAADKFSPIVIRHGRRIQGWSSERWRTFATLEGQDPTVRKTKSRWRTFGAVGVVIAGIFTWDYFFNARTLSRNTRTVWNGIMLTLDYK
jgi:hypothetical protein